MSVRTVTVAGFVVLAVVAVALYGAGRAHRLGLAPLGEVIDLLRVTVAGRLALVTVWAWVGWHLLAR